MHKDIEGRDRSRFMRWFHQTFDDLAFRSLIGPAQTNNAVDGSGQAEHDQWKRDLAERKRYSRELRERARRPRRRTPVAMTPAAAPRRRRALGAWWVRRGDRSRRGAASHELAQTRLTRSDMPAGTSGPSSARERCPGRPLSAVDLCVRVASGSTPCSM